MIQKLKQWIMNKWNNPEPELVKSSIYTSISVALLQIIIKYFFDKQEVTYVAFGLPAQKFLYLMSLIYALVVMLWNFRYLRTDTVGKVAKILIVIGSFVPIVTGCVLMFL